MERNKVLITGAAGQVGKELVDLCEKKHIPYRAYTSSQLDITDREKLYSEVQLYQPTAIINAAAYTAVDKAESDHERAYAVNRDGVSYLAEACKLVGAKLLHISTDYVFDGNKDSDYTVEDKPNPTSVYGASKLAGEISIGEIFDRQEDYLILRVSWIFGQYGNNFVKTMLRLFNKMDEVNVVKDQFGAPTPASEIARVLIDVASIKSSYCGIHHLESTPGCTWYEFAKEILDVAQNDYEKINKPKIFPIFSDQYPTLVKRPRNSKLASSEDFFKVSWLPLILPYS